MPNFSTSKGNQAMKFGQWIECNMRNIFLQKSYTKCDGETRYLWINSLKFYTICFYCTQISFYCYSNYPTVMFYSNYSWGIITLLFKNKWNIFYFFIIIRILFSFLYHFMCTWKMSSTIWTLVIKLQMKLRFMQNDAQRSLIW